MKQEVVVQAYKVTLTVDAGWFEQISKALGYTESGEVCQWEDTEGPFPYSLFECSECGYNWEPEEWLEDGKCPDGCDDEDDLCGDHGENEPTCDICGVGECFSNLEWNGETGNHVECEETLGDN